MRMHFIVRFFFLCFLIINVLSACRSRQLSTQTVPDRQLIFGSGGGFSGQIIEYTLLENGQLSRSNSLSKENQTLHILPQKETQSYFQQAQQLKLGTLNFKHPGNLYYFIRLKEGDRQQEIIWGDIDHPAPAQVQALYESLEKAASE